MAKISTYIKDSNLERGDLLLGTENNSNRTINIPLRALGDFVKDTLTLGSEDDSILTLLNGNLVPSSISNRFTTLNAGSVEPIVTLFTTITLSDISTINVGVSLDIFDNPLVADGTPILVENNTSGEFFYTTITSIDEDNRTITIPAQVGIDLKTFRIDGDKSNTITFIGHNGVVIDGDLTITGVVIGGGGVESSSVEIVNQNIDGVEPENVRLWTGTESAYQALVLADNINNFTLYHRRDG